MTDTTLKFGDRVHVEFNAEVTQIYSDRVKISYDDRRGHHVSSTAPGTEWDERAAEEEWFRQQRDTDAAEPEVA